MQVRVTRVRFPPPPLLLEKLFDVVWQGKRRNVQSELGKKFEHFGFLMNR